MTPVVCTTNHGFRLIVQPGIGKGVERSIYLTGTYEEGTLAVFSALLRPGDVALDVGANIGLMTLHAARLVGETGQVFSFEPMPDIFSQIESNIELNRAQQVRAYSTALGSQSNTLPLFAHPEINRGSSSLVSNEGAPPAAIAKIMPLDDFVSEEIRRPIRLIKIDVEGWELEVLRGASATLSRPDAPILCVECSELHPLEGGTVADLYTLLASDNKYRCFALKRGKARPSHLVPIPGPGELPHHDNIFCFPQDTPVPSPLAAP